MNLAGNIFVNGHHGVELYIRNSYVSVMCVKFRFRLVQNTVPDTYRPDGSVGDLENFRRLGYGLKSRSNLGFFLRHHPTMKSDFDVGTQTVTSRSTRERDICIPLAI